MRRASQRNERFLVDRRGRPSVVIMGIEDYIDTVLPEPDWLKTIRDRSRKHGTDKLTMREIDNIVAEVRRAERPRKAVSRIAK